MRGSTQLDNFGCLGADLQPSAVSLSLLDPEHQSIPGKVLVDSFHYLILVQCTGDFYSISNYFFQPFTHGFPHTDINELLSPDLLHQLIKGAFKDHLVMWVNDYIKAEYPASEALKIFDGIDWQ